MQSLQRNDLESRISALALPFGWTDAKVSFECTGEMASICETYLSRDFGHRPAIQAQESFRLLQPLIHKVAMRSDPHAQAEEPGKVELAHICDLSQIIKSEIEMAVCGDVLENPPQSHLGDAALCQRCNR